MKAAITCREMRRRMLERLDGGLAFEEELLLERHLDGCQRCRAHEARESALEEALALLPEPPSERLDVERSLALIRAAAQPRNIRRRNLALPIAAAAALLALLVLFAARDADTIDTEAPIADAHDVEALPLAPQSAQPAVDVPERAPEPAPEPASATIDHARLERAREEVRLALLESAAGLDAHAEREAVRSFAERFDRLTHKLLVLGWPRERLVAGQLEAEDARAARTAARYLGVRGDATSAAPLASALQRDDRKRSATRALADLGNHGLEGLSRALDDPQLRRLALRGIEHVGGDAAARTLERKFRGSASADLLDALAATGPPAVAALIRLRLDRLLPADALVELLARTPGAGSELARLLNAEAPGERALALAEAAARIDPEPALAAIEALCLERNTRARALACLGSIAHPEVIRALMRLRDSGRLSAAQLDPAIRSSVECNAKMLATLAAAAIEAGEVEQQSALLNLLIESDGRGAAPALAVLAGAPALDRAQRQAALQAVGELGTPAELPALHALFALLKADERHLAAACLLSLWTLGGEPACDAALTAGDGRQRERILSVLRVRHARARATVSIYKLARELEPWLEQREIREWSNAT